MKEVDDLRPDSNEDKLDWCIYGDVYEHVFLGLFGRKLDLILNPSKIYI